MSRDSKGFYMSLSHNGYSFGPKRGISFQLRPTGVRYFFAAAASDSQVRRFRARRININLNPVRDISTQYNTLVGGHLSLSAEKSDIAKARLIAHAETFYPKFVIPAAPTVETYAWVAFPMLGAAMMQQELRALAPLAVNLQVASGLRAFSIEEMTRTIFGEAPRQLQAAAAESLTMDQGVVNIDNLTFGSLLRGYLPPNEMSEVLRMKFGQYSRIQNMDKQSAGEIRLLLRRFSPKRIMRLVSGLVEDKNANGHMLLRDAAHQYADARKNHPDVVMDLNRQFRSFAELHETITHEYRKLKEPNLDVPYDDDLIESLSNVSLPDGARLIWPSCTHELLDWSTEMVNCVFAYGKDAAEGKSILLAIVDASGKMTVNAMIRGKRVIQCYGKMNATCADEPLIEALFKGLVEEEIIHEEEDHARWLRRW